ncbi:hypothetical protein [Streptomyces sp. NPDC004050]
MSDPLFVLLKRMSALLRALYRAAGVGTHELSVVYLHDDCFSHRMCDLVGPDLDDNSEDRDLHEVAVLLLRTALHGGLAVVFLRTPLANGRTAMRMWCVRDLTAQPTTASQAFSAYCNGPNGHLTGPEPGVDYYDAPVLAV